MMLRINRGVRCVHIAGSRPRSLMERKPDEPLPKFDVMVKLRIFFDERLSFAPFSYMISKVVSYNRHLLMVKPSLVECSLDISIFTQTEWFWLDAICINQGDEKEKAIQVPLLWKLFSDAESVLVYRGEPDGVHQDRDSRIQTVCGAASDQGLG
jgi:Heterokaryon incompatibility protein (HET)